MKEKIKAIYKEIANKELSFGCWVNNGHTIYQYFQKEDDILYKESQKKGFFKKIKGHPVLIGDVLDWISKNNKEYLPTGFYKNANTKLLSLWNDKRGPIEEQSEECIDYIYNLLK